MTQGHISTRYNMAKTTTQSLFGYLLFKQPQPGSTQGYHEQVNATARQIIELFGLSQPQVDELQARHTSPQAMTREVPAQSRQDALVAFRLLGTPEDYADPATIESKLSQAASWCQEVADEYGIDTRPVAEGITQVGRQLTSSSSR